MGVASGRSRLASTSAISGAVQIDFANDSRVGMSLMSRRRSRLFCRLARPRATNATRQPSTSAPVNAAAHGVAAVTLRRSGGGQKHDGGPPCLQNVKLQLPQTYLVLLQKKKRRKSAARLLRRQHPPLAARPPAFRRPPNILERKLIKGLSSKESKAKVLREQGRVLHSSPSFPSSLRGQGGGAPAAVRTSVAHKPKRSICRKISRRARRTEDGDELPGDGWRRVAPKRRRRDATCL